MGLNQVYKKREIRFDEGKEKWICDELLMDNASLSALKAAIDREGKKRRKVSMPAIWVQSYFREASITHVTITLIREDGKANVQFEGKRGRRSTEQVRMSELYPVEHLTLAQEWLAQREVELKAERAASDLMERLNEHYLDAETIREYITRKAEEEASAEIAKDIFPKPKRKRA